MGSVTIEVEVSNHGEGAWTDLGEAELTQPYRLVDNLSLIQGETYDFRVTMYWSNSLGNRQLNCPTILTETIMEVPMSVSISASSPDNDKVVLNGGYTLGSGTPTITVQYRNSTSTGGFTDLGDADVDANNYSWDLEDESLTPCNT